MKKTVITLSLLTAVAAVTAFLPVQAETNEVAQSTAQSAVRVGTVNFRRCVQESKLGQNQEKSINEMRVEMENKMQAKEQEFKDLLAKLQDDEYLDSLTPEAEEQLRTKAGMTNQEMQQLGAQFQQIFQQANMQGMQVVGTQVQEASKTVAGAQGLDIVLNEESCFFTTETNDVTDAVIAQMNADFDTQLKEKTETNSDAA